LHAKLLSAPHHGSNTSSTADFIKYVHPEYVLFSTGYLNKFKFPSKKVIIRYQQITPQMFNTVYTGALILKSGSMIIYRKIAHHYWNSF